MPAALAITPTSGNITATKSVTKVAVTGADQNATSGFDATKYPTMPEMRYYLTFELGGTVRGKSYVFGVDENGAHTFNNYIFPTAGSWTVRLSNAADNSSIQTLSATVA